MADYLVRMVHTRSKRKEAVKVWHIALKRVALSILATGQS